jgi:hypothetical protein
MPRAVNIAANAGKSFQITLNTMVNAIVQKNVFPKPFPNVVYAASLQNSEGKTGNLSVQKAVFLKPGLSAHSAGSILQEVSEEVMTRCFYVKSVPISPVVLPASYLRIMQNLLMEDISARDVIRQRL